MNRKTPTQHADPVRLVGLQTLLIGLEATLDRHVSDINDVRDQLGHPRIGVLRNALPAPAREEPLPYQQPGEAPMRQLVAAPQQQSGAQRIAHKSLGKKVSAIWKSKRAILEVAGMNRGIRGMPSNKLLAKAVRKLERLGIPIPGQDGQPVPSSRPAKASSKKPHQAPIKTGRSSKRMKQQISVSSTSRWALAHEAGLKPTTIPDKKMLDKARRIIEARKATTKAVRQQKSKTAMKAAAADMKQTQAREFVDVPADLAQEVVQPAV